ncbi:MAG: hypothetical protein ACE5JL_19545, partial [Dehalococcoidia bacterium]
PCPGRHHHPGRSRGGGGPQAAVRRGGVALGAAFPKHCLVVYSNRIFRTKVVWLWMMCGDQQRASLIATYMEEAGGFEGVDGLYVPSQAGSDGDPIYAVAAYKAA